MQRITLANITGDVLYIKKKSKDGVRYAVDKSRHIESKKYPKVSDKSNEKGGLILVEKTGLHHPGGRVFTKHIVIM